MTEHMDLYEALCKKWGTQRITSRELESILSGIIVDHLADLPADFQPLDFHQISHDACWHIESLEGLLEMNSHHYYYKGAVGKGWIKEGDQYWQVRNREQARDYEKENMLYRSLCRAMGERLLMPEKFRTVIGRVLSDHHASSGFFQTAEFLALSARQQWHRYIIGRVQLNPEYPGYAQARAEGWLAEGNERQRQEEKDHRRQVRHDARLRAVSAPYRPRSSCRVSRAP